MFGTAGPFGYAQITRHCRLGVVVATLAPTLSVNSRSSLLGWFASKGSATDRDRMSRSPLIGAPTWSPDGSEATRTPGSVQELPGDSVSLTSLSTGPHASASPFALTAETL